jgi:hypothetical protein
VVLYECETWSLTLKEEHRLGVFENRVLRKIFGPKREVGENCIMRSFTTWNDQCSIIIQRRHISDTYYFFIILFLMGLDWAHFGTAAAVWAIVPAPDGRWRWSLWSNLCGANWQAKPKFSEETCPSATLSTTSLTWPDPSSSPGRRRLTAWALAQPFDYSKYEQFFFFLCWQIRELLVLLCVT